LVAYLLSSDGQEKDETSIQENLPLYAEIYTPSLAKHGDPDRAEDSLRKQLHRDVEALIRAGITVHIEGAREGRLYSLPPGGFSLVEVDLSDEERAVLVGALRALRRDFPYAGPLRLALANLIGAASAGTLQGGYEDEEDRVTLAAVATRDDEGVVARVATLESAVSRRKRVRFDYYSTRSARDGARNTP
jgi:proteasome accessory factor B